MKKRKQNRKLPLEQSKNIIYNAIRCRACNALNNIEEAVQRALAIENFTRNKQENEMATEKAKAIVGGTKPVAEAVADLRPDLQRRLAREMPAMLDRAISSYHHHNMRVAENKNVDMAAAFKGGQEALAMIQRVVDLAGLCTPHARSGDEDAAVQIADLIRGAGEAVQRVREGSAPDPVLDPFAAGAEADADGSGEVSSEENGGTRDKGARQ